MTSVRNVPRSRRDGSRSSPPKPSRSGLLMSWILIPASAIFLVTYGADLLPVTYLGAAVAGVADLRCPRARPPASLARRDGVARPGGYTARPRRDLGVLADGRWLSFGSWSWYRSWSRWASCSSSARPACSSTSEPSRRCTRGSSPGSPSGSSPAASPHQRSCQRWDGAEHLCWAAAVAAGLWMLLLLAMRHRSAPSCHRRAGRAQPERRADLARPPQAPLRGPDRRLPDAVRGREPVAGLPRVRAGRRVLPRHAGARPLHQPVHRHRLRRRHPVPPRDRRAAAPALRAAVRADRQPGRRPRRWSPVVVALSSLQGAGATVVFVLIVAARVSDLVLERRGGPHVAQRGVSGRARAPSTGRAG